MDIIRNLIKCMAVPPQLKEKTGLVCGRDYTIEKHSQWTMTAKLKVPYQGWISTWYLSEEEIVKDRHHSRVDGNGAPWEDFVIYHNTPASAECPTQVVIPPGGTIVFHDRFEQKWLGWELWCLDTEDAVVVDIGTNPESYSWSEKFDPCYLHYGALSRFKLDEKTPIPVKVHFTKAGPNHWNST